MGLRNETLNRLIEAQYHYFASQDPQKAAEVVSMLMEPLYDIGRYSELLTIIEQTISAIADLDLNFFIFHARSLSMLGRHEQALIELNILEAQVKENPELMAAILLDRGNCLRRSGDLSKADEILGVYRRALKIYDDQIIPNVESDDDKHRALINKASALFAEGTIQQYLFGNPVEAMKRFENALQIWKQSQSKDEDGIAVTNKQIGEIYANPTFREFYSPTLAIEYFELALAMFREMESDIRVLETLYQLARSQRNDPEEAIKLFQEYREIARALQLTREEAVAKRHLAELEVILFEKKKPEADQDESRSIYLGSLQMLEEASRSLSLLRFDIWSRRVLANCYDLMGALFVRLGDLQAAKDHFERSVAVSSEDIFQGKLGSDVRRRLRSLSQIAKLYDFWGAADEKERLLSDYHLDFNWFKLEKSDWLDDLTDRLNRLKLKE